MLEGIVHHIRRAGNAAGCKYDRDCDAEIEGDRKEVQDRIEALEAGLNEISKGARQALARVEALEAQNKTLRARLRFAGEGLDGKA